MSTASKHSVALNNYLQRRGKQQTLSWEESFSGEPHVAEWTVCCKIGGVLYGTATGSQKAVAKEAAAKQALEGLGVQL